MDIAHLYSLWEQCTGGVCTDSRHIAPDSLFFALQGASFDGNAFAVQALRDGARYAVVSQPDLAQSAPELSERLILTGDTLTALQLLAAEHRRRLAIPIVGIVGSNGKTTTKELVNAVLSQKYNTYATHGNLNNHIGVPLTLLAMNHHVEMGVVEMGASAQGEIRLLCSISQPSYGIITNIGRAHLEGFGGVEGIRKGKGELFDYLAANGGRAFVPREDEVLVAMSRERADMATEYYSRTVAEGYESQLEGAYNRFNIAAAVAVGTYFGVTSEQMHHAVAAYTPSNNRSQRTLTGRNTLIVDCYNANPSSMQASLDNMADEEATDKLLILGDMLELGKWSDDEHRHVIAQAATMPHTRLWLVGPNFTAADNVLHCAEHVFQSAADVAAYLTAHPVNGATVLLKGSHGMALEQLISLF